jgi:pilus assembly protein CpaD
MARAAFFALLALVLPAALQGCEPRERLITYATWKQATAPAEPRIQNVALTHPVRFAPHSAALDSAEKTALIEFLSRQSIGSGSRVILKASLPTAADTGLVADRLGEVRRVLAARGLVVELASAAANGDPDEIGVTAIKAQVAPIACPGYNAPIVLDTEQRPILNPGCANAIDLGLMLENPNDLAQGRSLPPADGEGQSLSIQRYRTGQTYPPVTTSTTN